MDISIENLQKTKNNLPYDSALPHLGKCPKKSTSYSTDTCSAMVITTLFTTARKWEQPKCSSTHEWILKMRCICPVEYYSARKRNEIGR